MQIWGHHKRQWEQFLGQGLAGVCLEKGVASLGDHHRVNDQLADAIRFYLATHHLHEGNG